MKGHTEVEVDKLPNCDLCKESGITETAQYDAKTTFGSWASLCKIHFLRFGIGLGLGRGQKLVLKKL